MHIHHLNKDKHQNFLSENRRDPITGDKIVAGDKIVFCASCKSAFLLDSWQYIDQKHCSQTNTLAYIPAKSVIKVDKNAISLGHLSLEGVSQSKRFSDFFPFFLIGISSINIFNLFGSNSGLIMFSLLIAFMATFGMGISAFYKNSLAIKGKRLVINEGKRKGLILASSDIESVEVYEPILYKVLNWSNGFNSTNQEKQTYAIRITTRDKKEYKMLLRKRELKDLKEKTSLLRRFADSSLPPALNA